ncbi:MAG: hypothetical protein UU65_C0003G0122 [candidate division CPR2 bacterium GW2011_GWC1_41_48]|uniref:Uncharacterized protein n=1 Tax=candidate division CPR2 bacterium GW2011_GWC1_41_48 TaxID=1618344 RepID=A0A0G0WAG4_UNCC2|nr:MAG: hypothetical protein UT47_C0003G0128 [candidate division CPR2 bacterium GW2011_GWC2_39_35]KKR28350.1 MAG: hypothetical protein UT60_C0022G0006 [candidate division CPR2 bacterium GW2011_GWD2_39_7]KKR28385.1 MAG: hypothetical protein UT59_C0029G0009 [candidate division CPR2 bacterium GW2011_GWD1_39_7]KKS09067.1 MAG: hypothetical protein UU65_C0003G0122 [candidate division CPR2 bacterium GW2011_GWC1_41_48]
MTRIGLLIIAIGLPAIAIVITPMGDLMRGITKASWAYTFTSRAHRATERAYIG